MLRLKLNSLKKYLMNVISLDALAMTQYFASANGLEINESPNITQNPYTSFCIIGHDAQSTLL